MISVWTSLAQLVSNIRFKHFLFSPWFWGQIISFGWSEMACGLPPGDLWLNLSFNHCKNMYRDQLLTFCHLFQSILNIMRQKLFKYDVLKLSLGPVLSYRLCCCFRPLTSGSMTLTLCSLKLLLTPTLVHTNAQGLVSIIWPRIISFASAHFPTGRQLPMYLS